MNLRHSDRLGWTTKLSESHSEQFIDIKVNQNSDYTISFVNHKNKISAFINDSFKTYEIGSIKYDNRPVSIKIGKMDMHNGPSSHSEHGPLGVTYYQNLSIA